MYEIREVWNAAFWNKVGMLQNVKVGSIPIEKNNVPSNGLYTSEAWLLTIPKVPLAGKLETDQHNPGSLCSLCPQTVYNEFKKIQQIG